MKRARPRSGIHWLLYLMLVVAALSFIYPFVWMVMATLKPEAEVAGLSLWPSRFILDHYRAVFQKIPLGRAFVNSVFVATTVTALALVFSSITGYALAKLRFRGRELVFSVILFTMMLPFQITLIPMYIMMVNFGWLNTYQALIVPGMISAFGILILRQSFLSIPQDLLDAARIDGCSELRIIFQVVWPLSKPALITVGLITFMNSWNDVLWPIIVMRDRDMMTMPQAVALFAVGGQADAQLGTILAAATLLGLPIIAAYLFLQRHFIASMASSGLKT